MIRRKDFEDKNQWYNFTNWHRLGVSPLLSRADFSDFIVENENTVADNLSSFANEELLDTFEPNMIDYNEDFNDTLINSNYYNQINSYSNTYRIPDTGIYQYCFDMETIENEKYPIKTMNFSTLVNPAFDLAFKGDIDTSIDPNNFYNLFLYSLAHNTLIIDPVNTKFTLEYQYTA